jgi:hypothetical protein
MSRRPPPWKSIKVYPSHRELGLGSDSANYLRWRNRHDEDDHYSQELQQQPRRNRRTAQSRSLCYCPECQFDHDRRVLGHCSPRSIRLSFQTKSSSPRNLDAPAENWRNGLICPRFHLNVRRVLSHPNRQYALRSST